MNETFLVLMSGVLLGGSVGFGLGALSMRALNAPRIDALPPLPDDAPMSHDPAAVNLRDRKFERVNMPMRVVPVYRNGERIGEVVMED